jgi:hypothetical protein
VAVVMLRAATEVVEMLKADIEAEETAHLEEASEVTTKVVTEEGLTKMMAETPASEVAVDTAPNPEDYRGRNDSRGGYGGGESSGGGGAFNVEVRSRGGRGGNVSGAAPPRREFSP